MAILTKAKSLVILVVTSLVVMSCGIADSEKEWGMSLVYMPQASMQSGGENNNYHVPFGSNEYDKNYRIDESDGNNNINVVLGVYRSGLQDLEGYNVDVVARTDTVNYLLDEKLLDDAVLLPSDTYTLPDNVSVPDGAREELFHLEIDRAKLLEDYPSYVGSRLVLAVGIDNPSRYELNQSLSTTVVIVSADWDTLE